MGSAVKVAAMENWNFGELKKRPAPGRRRASCFYHGAFADGFAGSEERGAEGG
jgi:hypothetical protein